MENKLLARYPLGYKKRTWKQDNFILSLSSPAPYGTGRLKEKDELTRQKVRRSVKTSIDAGFNLIGCLWADSTTAMDVVRSAEGHGAKVLFQDLKNFGGMGENTYCEKDDLPGAITKTTNYDCVMGYCLWDEPLLDEHLNFVRKLADYCESVCPEKLAYTVAVPDYHPLCRWEDDAFAPYIEKYLDIIEPSILSFDYYPVGKPEYNEKLQLDNSSMWSDLEIARRAAQKRNMPLWFYYQEHHYHFHGWDYDFTFPMARAMANAGILYGAKGLEAYVEFDGFIDPFTGKKGVFFDEQKELNREISNLGNTLMALKCKRVIHDDTLLPDHKSMVGLRTNLSESELLTGGLFPRISVSEHEDDYGNMYLMVLNRDFKHTSHLKLSLKEKSNVYEVSKNDGEQRLIYTNETALPVRLAPGELALFRIQNASETPYTVEYYLDKDNNA